MKRLVLPLVLVFAVNLLLLPLDASSTTSFLLTEAETFVTERDGQSDVSFETAIEFSTGVRGSTVDEIFLRFDLTSITGTITEAILYMTGSNNTRGSVDIYVVDDDIWGENITYNTRPDHGDTAVASFTNATNSPVGTNITQSARLEYEKDGKLSLCLIGRTNRPLFHSKRNTGIDSDKWPQLKITTLPYDYGGEFEGGETLIFGDQVSEEQHGLYAINSEVVQGAHGMTGRRLNSEGEVLFEIACDPQKQNYITGMFYGEDEQSNGLSMTNLDGVDFRVENMDTEFMLSFNVPFENRFVFGTYMIPLNDTQGKNSVVLRLIGNNRSQNTKIIYKIVSHTSPMYTPQEQLPGEQPSLYQPNDYTIRKQENENDEMLYLIKQANLYTRRFMSTQIFDNGELRQFPAGSEDKITLTEAVEKGYIPPEVLGPVLKNRSWFNGDASWTNSEWRNWVMSYIAVENFTQMNAAQLFAMAYKGDWFDYLEAYKEAGKGDIGDYDQQTEREEMLRRVVAVLDFYCRAQGGNGGYSGYGNTWIGGTENGRKDAWGHPLEGFGHRALGAAFNMVYEDMENRGLLDEFFDANVDGVPVKRRDAYEVMFQRARNFLTDVQPGHAPNQDMADIIAAVRFDKGLELLNSEYKWSKNQVELFFRRALGYELSAYNKSMWISPKGILLEPNGTRWGGYSGDYGVLAIKDVGKLVEMAEEYDFETDYSVVANKAWNVIVNFLGVKNSSASNSEPVLGSESVTTWRNLGYPYISRYILDFYSCIQLRNPSALRSAEIYFEHNKLWGLQDSYPNPGVSHYAENALNTVELIENYHALKQALAETQTVQYKGEHNEDFAFADEIARIAAFRDNGTTVYAALHWRHSSSGGMVDDKARIRYTTPNSDTIANVRMELSENAWYSDERYDMGGHHILRYGNYVIVMNSEEQTPWTADLSSYGSIARDLLTGFSINLDIPVTIGPRKSLILKLDFPFKISQGEIIKVNEYNQPVQLFIASFYKRRLQSMDRLLIPGNLNEGEAISFADKIPLSSPDVSVRFFLFSTDGNIIPLANSGL